MDSRPAASKNCCTRPMPRSTRPRTAAATASRQPWAALPEPAEVLRQILKAISGCRSIPIAPAAFFFPLSKLSRSRGVAGIRIAVKRGVSHGSQQRIVGNSSQCRSLCDFRQSVRARRMRQLESVVYRRLLRSGQCRVPRDSGSYLRHGNRRKGHDLYCSRGPAAAMTGSIAL